MFGRKTKEAEPESLFIENDRIVTIDYKIEDENGEIYDSTEGKGPLSYIHGSDQIPQIFQEQLQGHRKSDQVSNILGGNEAYGVYDESKIQELERPLMEDEHAIEEGQIFETVTREGRRCIRILAVSDNSVTADLNHPLAGKVIRFSATVLNVSPGKH